MSSSQDSAFLSRHIHSVQQRSQAFFNHARDVSWRQPEIVVGYLEELQRALEELRAAEEELCRQNQELRITQQALETERQRYQELFEFAPDGYIVTDPGGDIREANQVAGQLFNIQPSHLIGRPIISFVAEADRRSFRSLLDQLPQINRIQEWEVVLSQQGDGTFCAALTVETVRDLSDHAIALRWLVRDITTRKQAEAQLRQVQIQNLELKELDRLKNQFLSTLSHELRTPMSAILGFSQLLQLKAQHLDAHLFDMAERITRNGKHLLRLIEELLNFSYLQANRPSLHPEPFDLVELIRQTMDELRSLLQQQSLSLTLHLPPEGFIIANDPSRLRQVLVNLISNAIKFTEAGSITITLGELPEGRFTLSVSDTGVGIAPEHQSKIFQEFWQVDQSTSRLKGGVGLGLAISKAIVELMQGSISVESQLGEGSTFRVELPRWL